MGFLFLLGIQGSYKLLKKSRKDTAGTSWFDLPTPTITPEIKKDLEIIKLRGVIDPKRHYKKAGSKSKELPKYFQRKYFLTQSLRHTGNARSERLKLLTTLVGKRSGRLKVLR